MCCCGVIQVHQDNPIRWATGKSPSMNPNRSSVNVKGIVEILPVVHADTLTLFLTNLNVLM